MQSPTAAAAVRHFGRPFGDGRAVSLGELLAHPESFASTTVRTEGEIARVCQAMGCWLELREGPEGQAVHVPMAGHSFFLPRDVAGRPASIEGEVSVRPRSPEEVAHLQGEGSQSAQLALSIVATSVEVR